MTTAQSRVLPRRRVAVLVPVLVMALLCCLGAEALAQDASESSRAAPESGTYLNLIWLALLVLLAGGWLYVTAWVADDAMGVGLNVRTWSSILLGTGIVGLLIAVLVHPSLILLMAAGLGTTFVLYVLERNKHVPEQFKLFFKGAPQDADAAEDEGESGRRVATESNIRIVNESGESFGDFVADHPEFTDASLSVCSLLASAIEARARGMRVEPTAAGCAALFNLDGVPQKVDEMDAAFGRAWLACVARYVGIGIGGKSRAVVKASLPGQEELQIDIRGIKGKRGPVLNFTMPDWSEDIYRNGLGALGMHEAMEERLVKLTGAPGSAIIISGSPKSGKTSTFHALIARIDIFTTDVVTLENRTAHELDHITRHQVDLRSEEAFGAAFPAILREEPDVVCVDELTNFRIAPALFEFVVEGGRLLATVEASDTAEAVAQLAHSVEGPVLGRTLGAVIGQRPVRMLCERCKEPLEPNPALLKKLRLDPSRPGTWFRATGCEVCLNVGYRGTTSLFEMLIVNEQVRQALAGGPVNAAAIKKAAGARGIRSLFQDALLKVRQGVTTLEEIRRVLKQ